MLSTLAIGNYRSLRDLLVPLSRLTIVTGPNGSGKSSVYRAMRLPAAVEADKVAAAFKDGVVTITLPKATEAKGTTIPVKAA